MPAALTDADRAVLAELPAPPAIGRLEAAAMSKMNGGSEMRIKPRAIGVAWFRAEDYQRIREISDDEMIDTFEEFEARKACRRKASPARIAPSGAVCILAGGRYGTGSARRASFVHQPDATISAPARGRPQGRHLSIRE